MAGIGYHRTVFACLYTAFFCSVACAAVFFFGNPRGHSWIDKLYRCLFITQFQRATRLLRRVLGERNWKVVRQLLHYIFYTNNPLVQIFYLFVVGGGYLLFVFTGYPFIPGPFLSSWHLFTAFGISMACLFCFLVCSISDPGIIHEHNADALSRVYQYDGHLFVPQQECRTCHFVKPARSKHCSLCNHCVARFDHHCVWIGNCIGANNHKHFLLFLLLNTILCFYGAFLCGSILLGVIKSNNLFEATFVEGATGKRLRASYMLVLTYLLGHYTSVSSLLAICAVFSLVLFCFSFWHVYMALWVNKTTNENFKSATITSFTPHIYSRGLVENFCEVFRWSTWLQRNVKKQPRKPKKSTHAS